MRIGIDARRYQLAGRGQERYVRGLVGALAALDTGHDLVLLYGPGGRPIVGLGGRVSSAPARLRLRTQYRRGFGAVRRLLVRDLDLVHFPVADGWYKRVTRTVVTIHDLSVLRYPGAYFSDAAAADRARRHHEAITANADAVITVSRTSARDVVELLNVREDRVAVVPSGVEPAFRPLVDAPALERMRLRLGLPDRYLLFVGGIDFKKNVARLIEGFAIACWKGRLLHGLVLAGPLQQPGNPFFDAARERAAAAGIADRVAWAGYVPEEELPSVYSAADALLYPSTIEGFGFPVLEAMACGTPVVTSAGSAMAESTGEDAALVDPADPESIAAGILRALEPDEALRLAEAGRLRAAGYTWQNTARRTVEVYERVAAVRRPREVRT